MGTIFPEAAVDDAAQQRPLLTVAEVACALVESARGSVRRGRDSRALNALWFWLHPRPTGEEAHVWTYEHVTHEVRKGLPTVRQILDAFGYHHGVTEDESRRVALRAIRPHLSEINAWCQSARYPSGL